MLWFWKNPKNGKNDTFFTDFDTISCKIRHVFENFLKKILENVPNFGSQPPQNVKNELETLPIVGEKLDFWTRFLKIFEKKIEKNLEKKSEKSKK